MESAGRPSIWLTAGIAVLVATAAVVIAFFIVADDAPPEGWSDCRGDTKRDHVRVYFDTDEDMSRAFSTLRDNDRIVAMDTRSKAENFAEFKELNKDQPELVKLVRLEAMPASLHVLPADDVSDGDLAEQLRTELTKAESVESGPCDEEPAPTGR